MTKLTQILLILGLGSLAFSSLASADQLNCQSPVKIVRIAGFSNRGCEQLMTNSFGQIDFSQDVDSQIEKLCTKAFASISKKNNFTTSLVSFAINGKCQGSGDDQYVFPEYFVSDCKTFLNSIL